jgi:hypothetical protein
MTTCTFAAAEQQQASDGPVSGLQNAGGQP